MVSDRTIVYADGTSTEEERRKLDLRKTGSFLKTLRNEKGLTQEQLAEHFRVSNRTVSRWETGSNLPDISLLVEIADFYDVDVREIIDGERRHEMNEEVKEVATKMADYAGSERKKQFSPVMIVGIIGMVLIALSIGFQYLTYRSGFNPLLSIVFSCLALVVMAAVVLYSNGVLARLKKHKGLYTAVIVVTAVILAFAVKFALQMAFTVGFGIITYSQPYNTVSGVDSYNKDEIVSKFGEDLDSGLFLFPDDTGKARHAEFESSTKEGLFDTDGYFILTADYDDAGFASELDRLASVKCRITDSNGNSIVNEVSYDTESYNYPAYVASDGYDYVYEYALVDETNNRIIYVLLSYPETERLKDYMEYLKKDTSRYDEPDNDSLNRFSIYSHSFNGEVWIEWDYTPVN